MKKALLFIGLFTAIAATTKAQIIAQGISPSNIAGNYDFTWADPGGGDWSSPDFNIPGTNVQDTLMLVDDGSTGTNPQGNPISAEGCNPLVNDLTGKIAVIYRNTCEFGTKSLNAQNAGAVAVIIVNREEGLVNMGGGNDGFNVTIPVVFLQNSDGQSLIDEMANGPVVMFLGNRTGNFANDLSIDISDALIPQQYALPTQLALLDNEVSFDLGITCYNFGYDDATSTTVTATVTDPAGTVLYDETLGPFSLTGVDTNTGALDSVILGSGGVDSFPTFNLVGPNPGRFTVAYTTQNGSVTDDFSDDNTVTTDLLIDQDFCYAEIDANDVTQTSAHYRPAESYSSYSACIHFRDANAERIGVDGLWFSASAADSLTNQSFYIKAFHWGDEFTDLLDENLAFDNMEELGAKTYTFTENLEETMVYVEFDEDIPLQSNERYVFCVQTFDPTVFIGHDTRTNYIATINHYLQPIGILEMSGVYDEIGFGADAIPSIRLGILDSSEIVIPEDTTPNNTGIEEMASFQLNAYPNPSKDQLLVLAEVQGMANVSLMDVTGKVAMQDQVNFTRNNATLNLAGLRAGVYFLRVQSEDGRISQTRVIKQ